MKLWKEFIEKKWRCNMIKRIIEDFYNYSMEEGQEVMDRLYRLEKAIEEQYDLKFVSCSFEKRLHSCHYETCFVVRIIVEENRLNEVREKIEGDLKPYMIKVNYELSSNEDKTLVLYFKKDRVFLPTEVNFTWTD